MAFAMKELNELLSQLQQVLPNQCSLVSAALCARPDWFKRMEDGSAIDDLERRFGIFVAESIRSFYRFPAYAVFLKVHQEMNVFMDDWIGHIPEGPAL
jgi:hypothetical protein